MGEASYIAYGTVGANEMGVSEGAVSASGGVVVDSSKNISGFTKVTSTSFSGIFEGALSSSAQIKTNISGSFTDASSSFSTRVTRNEATGSSLTSASSSFSTRVTRNEASASALTTDSGSFSTRITAATSSISAIKTDSGSFSTRITTNTSTGSILAGSGNIQGLGSTNSPTFVNVTATGTMTAQEFHTEFVSASIVYTSGSTKFGDTADDIHQMTGSLRITGSGNHYFTDGNVGIGNTAPSQPLTVAGNISGSGNLDIDGNMTASGDAYFGSNVGIGTTAPASTLEVAGKLTVDASNSYIDLQRGGTTKATIGADSNGDFLVYSNSGYRFVVSGSSGNVGIGTTSPQSLLHIQSSGASFKPMTWESTDGTYPKRFDWWINDKRLFLQDQTNGAYRLAILDNGNVGIGDTSPSAKLEINTADNDTTTALKVLALDDGGYDGTVMEVYGTRGPTTAYNIAKFGTNAGTAKIVFDGEGKVGIGTNNPAGAINIAGAGVGANLYIDAHSADSDGGNIIIRKSRNATIGNLSDEPNSGDALGSIYFQGADSDSWETGALIRANADENWGSSALGTVLTFHTVDNTTTTLDERVRIDHNGKVGIGNTGPGYALSVHDGVADYVAEFRNTTSGTPYKGITIQCGYVGANFVNTAIQIKDGDGDEQGTITFTGGTVAYNTFTAGHFVELPSSDNDDGYDYGTLVETTEIFYTQVNNADSERGILYKVQKSSSAYSKGVLGIYSGKFDDKDNLHQVYVLGDGHILCNGEKGNILVGDGICASSTNGEGMKADKMAMIIGIAQEDVSFSGSESKLVAVQYGLQQFTPWENA